MGVTSRQKSICFVLFSQISKAKSVIKQRMLEAQTHRSRARAFSDRKSNRIRAPRISPNITPADVPAQSEGYPETDCGALKNYLTRFQLISSYPLTPCLVALIMTQQTSVFQFGILFDAIIDPKLASG